MMSDTPISHSPLDCVGHLEVTGWCSSVDISMTRYVQDSILGPVKSDNSQQRLATATSFLWTSKFIRPVLSHGDRSCHSSHATVQYRSTSFRLHWYNGNNISYSTYPSKFPCLCMASIASSLVIFARYQGWVWWMAASIDVLIETANMSKSIKHFLLFTDLSW